jgi:hypothetical protein
MLMAQPVYNSFLQPTTSGFLTCVYAYDGDGNVEYIGRAHPGTAQSAALWQIQKLTYSSGDPTDVKWAGGTAAFIHVWNNRASFSYS